MNNIFTTLSQSEAHIHYSIPYTAPDYNHNICMKKRVAKYLNTILLLLSK